ncbi:hypothetical protein DFAR_2120013 [Desulfarculales bacterium]
MPLSWLGLPVYTWAKHPHGGPTWMRTRKNGQPSSRLGVISDFFAMDYMERGERERLLRDQCAQRWQVSFSSCTRLSRSTILRWVRLALSPRRWQSGIPLSPRLQGRYPAPDRISCNASPAR